MTDALALQKQVQARVITDTLKRIADHKGVIGYFAMHPRTGHILQVAGFQDERPEHYAEKLHALLLSAHSTVRTISHTDAVTFLRMRMRHREIIMAPDLGGDYVLVVVHEHQQQQQQPKTQ